MVFLENLTYIKGQCNYKKGSLSVLLMFLSEFIAGFIFYKYEKKLLTKNGNKRTSSFMGIKLIESSQELGTKPLDSNLKIIFLMLAATFFDFYDTILFNFLLPNLYDDFSSSLIDRLECISAILTSFLCYFLLNFPIYKHQKCSLVVIFICFIIIIISEYFIDVFFIDEFKKKKMLSGFIIALISVLIDNFFFSILLVVEKYLIEYDFINPFQMLMYEGAFGSIMGFIYAFINEPFKEFKEVYNKEDKSKFIILIIGLIIYYILIGVVNSYRVKINKLFSPTHIAFIYYISSPITIITNFVRGKDFKTKGQKNYQYFLFNLIISIIMFFCGCIYNEFIVLFCCNLEHDTYYQISIRAKIEDNLEYNVNKDANDSF